MADNVNITEGSGVAIAADDVSSVLYQRIKVDLGADGAASPLVRGAQTAANSIPVTTATDDPTAVSLAVLDDWDESDRAKVNPIVGQAGVAAGAGAVSATVQRVTLASDDPGVTHLATIAGDTTDIETAVELLDDTVYTDGTGTVSKGIAVFGQDGTNPQAIKTDSSGELQVDVLTMPTVAVTQSGTWDEVGINDSGNSITVDNAQLSVVGSGTEAAAMRVTIATDSTGVLSVDDNDSSLTVDNAHLTSLGGAISGTEVQVDVVGALPAGTNAIGKLAANSGVDIGDVDVTTVGTITPGTAATSLGKAEDGGHTSGDVGVMALAVRSDTPSTALAGTDLDYTPIAVSSTGAVRPAPISEDFAALANGPQVKKYYTSAGAATDGIIWSPAAGKRWYVTDIFIQVSAAATVTLEDDKAGGDEAIWKAELAANSGWSHSFTTPWFSGEDAADLMITTTAGNVYVMVTGYEI